MMPHDPPDLIKALQTLKHFLESRKIRFCLIGGLAVQIRGKPRFTHDIDLTILADLSSENELIDLLLSAFEARIDNAKDFALTNKVLLIHINGVPVDIGIGLTGFERLSIERATIEGVSEGLQIPVCSAEDLVVHKVLAARPGDLSDIRHVLIRNRGKIDEQYIISTLRQFEALLEQPLLNIYLEQKEAVGPFEA